MKSINLNSLFKSVLYLIFPALIIVTACNNDDDHKVTPAQYHPLSITVDTNFITNAAQVNIAEIQLGQLAIDKSSNDSIISFGRLMISEHTVAQTELRNVAASQVFKPFPDSLNAVNQALVLRLATLSGFAFDTAYINSQIFIHQKALEDYQLEINQGQLDFIKAYAIKFEPLIQVHLNKAIAISDSIR